MWPIDSHHHTFAWPFLGGNASLKRNTFIQYTIPASHLLQQLVSLFSGCFVAVKSKPKVSQAAGTWSRARAVCLSSGRIMEGWATLVYSYSPKIKRQPTTACNQARIDKKNACSAVSVCLSFYFSLPPVIASSLISGFFKEITNLGSVMHNGVRMRTGTPLLHGFTFTAAAGLFLGSMSMVSYCLLLLLILTVSQAGNGQRPPPGTSL